MANSTLRELFRWRPYKSSQGRVTRQVTVAALGIFVVLGVWSMQNFVAARTANPWLVYVVPGALLLLGAWVGFRVYNLPRFADFLIAVEAEMNKVTWPTRSELLRSSLVVILVIFSLAIVLFGYDIVWQSLFQWIGVLQTGS